MDGQPARLVLIDGEGLGHTPKSTAVLPTAVAKTMEEVDAVLLVDSAAQPMQAASTWMSRYEKFWRRRSLWVRQAN